MIQLKDKLQAYFSNKPDLAFTATEQEVAIQYKGQPICELVNCGDKIQINIACQVKNFSDLELLKIKSVILAIVTATENIAKGLDL